MSNGRREENMSKADQVNLKQLEMAHSAVERIYGGIAQWAALLVAAWAALLAVGGGGEYPRAILMLFSGVPLLVMAWEFYRGGVAAGALTSIALGLEHDLGIDPTQSLAAGFFVGARGGDMVKNLRDKGVAQSAKKRNDKNGGETTLGFDAWLEMMSNSKAFGIFHPKHSKTVWFVGILVIGQTAWIIWMAATGKVNWF